MGGYVCLAFTEMFPNKVKGLGLINSTPLPDSEEKKVIRDRAIEAVQQNYKTFARIAIPSLFSKNNRLRLKNDIDLLVGNALKMDPKSVIAVITGMKVRKDRSSIFLNGSFKKLLLLADHDPVLNTSDLLELNRWWTYVFFRKF
jgi:pimeloyl-ACP methyl ester carboxylesterase